MNKKKLLIIISVIIFIFLIIIICLFFCFRYKNNLNLNQTSQNSQTVEQIIEQNNIQDISKNSNVNINEKIHENKNLNFESSNQNKINSKKQDFVKGANKLSHNNKKLDINIKKLVYNKEYCDKLKVEIEVEYPVITNKNNSKFIDKINKKNKIEAEKEFNECKLGLEQTAEAMIKSSDLSSSVLYYNEKCEITRNDNIISIAITGEWYAGGVVDRPLKSKNYDLKNEKELTLTDVLSGSKKNIIKMITEKTQEYLGNDHDLYDDYFRNHDLKNFKFHIENKDSKDFLILDFSKYEISDGAAGAPSIEIPFLEIKQKYKIKLKI